MVSFYDQKKLNTQFYLLENLSPSSIDFFFLAIIFTDRLAFHT